MLRLHLQIFAILFTYLCGRAANFIFWFVRLIDRELYIGRSGAQASGDRIFHLSRQTIDLVSDRVKLSVALVANTLKDLWPLNELSFGDLIGWNWSVIRAGLENFSILVVSKSRKIFSLLLQIDWFILATPCWGDAGRHIGLINCKHLLASIFPFSLLSQYANLLVSNAIFK